MPDRLCEDCCKLDFDFLLSHEVDRQDVGSLANVWRTVSCPFCRLIRAAFREHITNSSHWHKLLIRNGLKVDFHIGSIVSRRIDDIATAAGFAHQIRLSCVTMEGETRITNIVSYFDLVQEQRPAARMPKYSRRALGVHCDMELLQNWVRNCDLEHEHAKNVVTFPAHLIADGRLRGLHVDTLKITALSDDERYCSLSYVCGDITQTALNARYWVNADTYVVHDALPQVIQDALLVAKHFGLTYLW